MLEVEKRYQALQAKFQKYEKIRIEQWVLLIFAFYLAIVQKIMSGDLEFTVEKE